MANIADCAFAVAKDELDKLNGAVAKTDRQDGYEFHYKWHIKKGEEEHEVEHYHASYFPNVGENKTIAWYKVDGEKIAEKVYIQKYSEQGFVMTNEPRERLADKEFSNGYMVDWAMLNSCPYDSDTNVQEYDDHITVYFGGRWDFPTAVEDFLNKTEIRWQGAGCEDGMGWSTIDLGNYDFGLRIERERCDEDDDDGKPMYYHFVEDQTN